MDRRVFVVIVIVVIAVAAVLSYIGFKENAEEPPVELNFSISVSPTSGEVVQGGSTTANVALMAIYGYSEDVALNSSGQPSGVTVSFSLSSDTPSFSSTVNVDVDSSVTPGTYTITITATGTTKTHSTSYELTVTEAGAVNPVLFVHGWIGSSSNWDWMIDKFVSDGWPREMLYAFTFSNPGDSSSGANARNAGEIAEWVDQILAETGSEKVDLVSHSMGGLSTRYYVKYLGGIDKVDDFVSLGSPHHGTTLAIWGDMKPDSAFLEILNDGDESPGGVLPDTEGWRDDPVGEDGYNGVHVLGDITWTSIRSNSDSLVRPPETVILDGAVNMERSIGHLDLIEDEQIYEWVKTAIE